MSDHIERQNRITLRWLEWRRKLPYVPTLQEQLAFCRQIAKAMDWRRKP